MDNGILRSRNSKAMGEVEDYFNEFVRETRASRRRRREEEVDEEMIAYQLLVAVFYINRNICFDIALRPKTDQTEISMDHNDINSKTPFENSPKNPFG